MSELQNDYLEFVPGDLRGLSSHELHEKWLAPSSYKYTEGYFEEIISQRKKVFEVLENQELEEQKYRFGRLQNALRSRTPEGSEHHVQKLTHEVLMLFLDTVKGYVDSNHLLNPQEQIVLRTWRNLILEGLQKSTNVPEFIFDSISGELDRLVFCNAIYRLLLRVLFLSPSSEQPIRDILKVREYPEYQVSEDQPDREAILEIKRLYGEEALKEHHEMERNRIHFARVKTWDSPRILTQLAHSTYSDLRMAKYPPSPEDYSKALGYMENDQSLRGYEEGTWFYRGVFESDENTKTLMRGSLNISISREALEEIDELIRNHLFVGNYKIGNRGQHESNYRHDSVTLYFLKTPTPELLQALSGIATKYHRGHHLLGRKIVDGFSLGEIDNIDRRHIPVFLHQLGAIDPVLEGAARVFLKDPEEYGGNPLGCSEGQYYALKSALKYYGVEFDYSIATGFVVRTSS
jgi:hypothetical protein